MLPMSPAICTVADLANLTAAMQDKTDRVPAARTSPPPQTGRTAATQPPVRGTGRWALLFEEP
jgi:hypothetical protein